MPIGGPLACAMHDAGVHGVSSDYLLGEERGRGAYPSALSAVEYWLCGKRAPGEGMEQGGGGLIRSPYEVYYIYIHHARDSILTIFSSKKINRFPRTTLLCSPSKSK